MSLMIWALIATLIALLVAVAQPILAESATEHVGATEDWSPLAEVGPASTSHEFAMGTGWPA